MNLNLGNANNTVYNKIRNISSKNLKIGMIVSNDISEIIKKKKALVKYKQSQDSKQSSSAFRRLKEFEYESFKNEEKKKILKRKRNKTSSKIFSFDDNEENQSLIRKNSKIGYEIDNNMKINSYKLNKSNSLKSNNKCGSNCNTNKKIELLNDSGKNNNSNLNEDNIENNNNDNKKGLK